MEPLPPWPIGPQAQSDAKSEQPDERATALWLLSLGGRWHLSGRTLMERHLVSSEDELPAEVSALLGAKLPAEDPRTDAILERLAGLEATRGLQQLDLSRTSVGPKGVAQAARFAWMQSLDLSSTSLELADLAPLKSLPELQRLELAGTAMGALEYTDIFGADSIPSALRHPIAAVQRALARLVDLTLVSLPLHWLAPPTGLPSWLDPFAMAMLSALLLLPLEACLLAWIGSTPGKALLRVLVLTLGGERPKPRQAIERALRVGLQGWGLGLRPISWCLGAYWFARLWKGEAAPWDSAVNTRAIARNCLAWRLMLACALVAIAPFAPRLLG